MNGTIEQAWTSGLVLAATVLAALVVELVAWARRRR
jgi:hypothetical protein